MGEKGIYLVNPSNQERVLMTLVKKGNYATGAFGELRRLLNAPKRFMF
jgi:hypothetical protein